MRVELNGHVTIPAPREQVYRVLTTPEGLLRTMPGLKSLEPDDSGGYRAIMEIGVSAVRGRYSGVMALHDQEPPRRYRLTMSGQGPGAFVTIDLTIELEEAEDGTTALTHTGTAQVGGTMAGVGQRVMGGVASMILGQFFQAVGREAAAAEV
jgi:carbon monoxide dehydrogenase subunit G